MSAQPQEATQDASWLWGRLTDGLVAVNGLAAVVFFFVAVLWAATGSQAVQFIATPFSIAAFSLTNLGFLISAFSPRVPLRVTVPLFVWQWYLALGAMPFGVLALVNHWSILWLAAASLAVVGLVMGLVRQLPRNAAFSVQRTFWSERAAFSATRALVVLAVTAVSFPVAVTAYGLASAAWTVDYATRGYAGLTGDGFVIRGRTFERQGTRVYLQGMMHIGEKGAYEDLYASFGAQPSTVVLTEGVGDETGALAGVMGYGRVAERLGIEEQKEIVEDGFEVRNADVDVSQFSEETLDMLRASLGVWQSDDPVTAWLTYSLQFSTTDPDELYRTLYQDVVVTRNDEVLRELSLAEPDFAHIFVPWGAAHLPGIEAALLSDGWAQTSESERVLVSWRTVSSALR